MSDDDPRATRVARLLRLISELQQVREDAVLLVAAAELELTRMRAEVARVRARDAV